MKKKPKTLGRFLTKKYITTSLLLLVLVSLFGTMAQFFISSTNEMIKNLCAQTIVRPDYKKPLHEDYYPYLQQLASGNPYNNILR